MVGGSVPRQPVASSVRGGICERQRCLSLEPAWRWLGELMGYCDVCCEKGHGVDGNVWYADRFLYPNHWYPGSKLQPILVDDGQSCTWFSVWAATALIRLGLLFLAILLVLAFV